MSKKKKMSLLTLDDFKDRHIDPNWSPFGMLAEVVAVATQKYKQEHPSFVSCVPGKPNVVSKVKFPLGPNNTEADNASEISKKQGFPKKPISLGCEFMDSDIEGALRINDIKNGELPTISETKPHLKEVDDDQIPRLRKRTVLKPTDSTLFYEWIPGESSKKQKRSSKISGGTERDNQLKLKQELPMGAAESQPDLPQEFKNKIVEMGGNEIILVIQKVLYATDLNPQNNRLSMPLKRMKTPNFLREWELQRLLQKKAIEVPMIEPSLEVRNINLAKWDMPKVSGPTSSSYVLRSSWKKVAVANQLKLKDEVQIWSFRVKRQLCMALVKVVKES